MASVLGERDVLIPTSCGHGDILAVTPDNEAEVRTESLKGLCYTCEAARAALAALDAGQEDVAVKHVILWVQGMFHAGGARREALVAVMRLMAAPAENVPAEMSELITVTRSCGHHETHDMLVTGQKQAEMVKFLEGRVCSSCWHSEPLARERLRSALLNPGTQDGQCRLGYALEMYARWLISMGDVNTFPSGGHSESQHQACLLGNELGQQHKDLRDGLNRLLLEITDRAA